MTFEQLEMITALKKRLSLHKIETRYVCHTQAVSESITFTFSYVLWKEEEARTFPEKRIATLTANWHDVNLLSKCTHAHKRAYYDKLTNDIAMKIKARNYSFQALAAPEVPPEVNGGN